MALCKYLVPAREPDHGFIKRWGWLANGRVESVSGLHVITCFDGGNRKYPKLQDTVGNLSDLRQHGSEDDVTRMFDELNRQPILRGTQVVQSGLMAPIASRMEVWAAGVTYESSKFARMAESEEGGDFYARAYVAERPELFFKATPNRVVGPNAAVRIRADSKWNVPEPELAVVAAADGRILGYTIGNDMSSRDIEGANPLYLPQAKVYMGSCALGPVIVPAENLDPSNLPIRLTITRNRETAFAGETNTLRMRRSPQELVDWLFRENEFPHGVVLLTGTGIIPPDDFTLEPDDELAIEIEGIGVLRNTVSR